MEKEAGKRLAVDPNQKKKRFAILIISGVLAVLAAGYAALSVYAGGHMYPKTTILGTDVSGMAIREAHEMVNDWVSANTVGRTILLREPVSGARTGVDITGLVSGHTFRREEQSALLPQGAIYLARLFGGWEELEVELQLQGEGRANLDTAMNRLARAAGLDVQETAWQVTDNALIFTKGRTGRAIQREPAEEALGEAILRGEETVEVTVSLAPPAEPDLEALQKQLYAQVSEAYLDEESLEIVPSVTGRDFDVEGARAALAATAEGRTCAVPLKLTFPQVSTEALEEKLFRDILGEAVTKVTGTSDRRMNVGVAADLLNGLILFPGQEFSFNKICSPYTEEHGYGKATAYVNGLSKDTVAGGICQASSTLYWATLKADLETLERSAHRYEPSYVTGGLDATVYGDYGEENSLDFRFRNTSENPIKIEAFKDEKNYLHVTIYGTDTTGIHGEPYSTNRVVTKPYETIYQAKDSVPQGTTQTDPERTGYNGVTIETYQRLVDAEGKEISNELLYKTKYFVRNEIIFFNPADLELWNIDPITGIRTEPEETPEPVPEETPAPPQETQPGAPEETPPPWEGVLPPELVPAVPPVLDPQPPVWETPPAVQETEDLSVPPEGIGVFARA